MKIIFIIIICLLVIVTTICIIWGAVTQWKFSCKKNENYEKKIKKESEINKTQNYIDFNTKLTGKINVNIDKLSMPFISNGKVNEAKLFSKKRKMNHKNQKDNLLLLKQALESNNIIYHIDGGTLLGAVRDKGFIKGDHDADIQLLQNDIKKLRLKLYPELEKLGFIVFRLKGNHPGSLLRKGEYIDFHGLYKTHIPFELISYPFLGTYFPVPKYYKSYLTTIYGNWKVKSNRTHLSTKEWLLGMPNYVKKFGLTI